MKASLEVGDVVVVSNALFGLKEYPVIAIIGKLKRNLGLFTKKYTQVVMFMNLVQGSMTNGQMAIG